MKKIKNSNWVVIFAFLFFINVLSLWCMDLSQTAMIDNAIINTQKEYGVEVLSEGYLTNGIFNADPMLSYHLSMLINLVINFLILMLVVHLLVRD